MLGCKGQNDNCANGCGVRARYEYCNGVCQGKGGDCVTVCAAQKTSIGDPTMKWIMIAQCSKGVRYPEGVRCNDSS